jgi:hypothetical protein
MIWRWPSQSTFGMWTVLYWTRSSRTQFGVSINVRRLAGDILNINCNFLYCNHQVHREFLITLFNLLVSYIYRSPLFWWNESSSSSSWIHYLCRLQHQKVSGILSYFQQTLLGKICFVTIIRQCRLSCLFPLKSLAFRFKLHLFHCFTHAQYKTRRFCFSNLHTPRVVSNVSTIIEYKACSLIQKYYTTLL